MKCFRRTSLILVLVVTAMLGPSISKATVIQADQSNGASETAFDGNISALDLINNGNPLRTAAAYSGGVPGGGGFTAVTDGLAAANSIAFDAYISPAALSTGAVATYTFDTVLNPYGYNITGINTFNGWRDSTGYSNQRYRVEVSLVGSATFSLLADVTYSPFNPGGLSGGSPPNSSQVSLTDSTGILATGVDQIRITWLYTNATLSPDGQVVREADVYGTALTVPEPSTLALLGLGAIGLAVKTRRRRTAA